MIRACFMPWFAASVLTLIPGAMLAEGAVRVLDCNAVRVCDAAGSCEPAAGETRFLMEPQALDSSGAARFTLSYGDVRADMEAMSDVGPFLWTAGSERHALLVSSETQWLWHRLTLEPAPVATVAFLECTFAQ
jgi:hypothetical protein